MPHTIIGNDKNIIPKEQQDIQKPSMYMLHKTVEMIQVYTCLIFPCHYTLKHIRRTHECICCICLAEPD